MARTSQKARRYEKPIMTWTRFYLPPEQEWPTWSVTHEDVHAGPLANVKGVRRISLGRMVETPEQAAYIIEWYTIDDVENFKSSPACAELLQNLPQDRNGQASIETGSDLSHLTLDHDGSLPSPSPSRFLTFRHVKPIPTAELEGRVTFNLFLIPQKDDITMRMTWFDQLQEVFCYFIPRGVDFVRLLPRFSYQYLTLWFWIVSEDGRIEEMFGKLDETGGDSEGRTIVGEIHVWPSQECNPEQQEALVTDTHVRESWRESVAKVMPPVTAWQQEHWNIHQVPRHFPPKEVDPESAKWQEEMDEMKQKLRNELEG